MFPLTGPLPPEPAPERGGEFEGERVAAAASQSSGLSLVLGENVQNDLSVLIMWFLIILGRRAKKASGTE